MIPMTAANAREEAVRIPSSAEALAYLFNLQQRGDQLGEALQHSWTSSETDA